MIPVRNCAEEEEDDDDQHKAKSRKQLLKMLNVGPLKQWNVLQERKRSF
jgi:hypothetical protein